MRRLTTLILALLAGPAAAQTPQPMPSKKSVKWVSYDEGLKQAKAEPTKVWVVVWTREGCPPCQRMELGTLCDPRVVEVLTGWVVCSRVDADDEKAKAKAVGVTVTPSVTIAADGGKKAITLSGHQGAGELLDAIARMTPEAMPPPPKAAAPKFAAAPRFPLLHRMLARLNPAVQVMQVPGNAGSGTCVKCVGGTALVLTNRHVVQSDSPNPWYVVTATGSFPARVVAVSPDADLALLSCDATLPVARLAASDEPGTAVVRTGFGGGAFRRLAGRLLGMDGGDRLTSMPSISGDSGSGVLNERGELVAVCWGQRGDAGQTAGPLRHNENVPLAAVRKFLAPHLAD